MKNFYPDQYLKDKDYQINHNYLKEQFLDYDEIFNQIKEVVKNNDFTLGEAVDELESLIAKEADTEFAIGVGSGTDAIRLTLKALGIGDGDEVITTAYTFYATIGAIATTGAKPVLVDVRDDYNINPEEVIKKITKKTKAIVPVHWSGRPCDMESLNKISQEFEIPIVEDACHALQAEYFGKRCGSLGAAGCFSFHPLKNLNVWGDGGIVTTNSEYLNKKLKLIRNHGLINRDTCQEFAYNSRLDTIQAVVAKYLIQNKLENITYSRRSNAQYLDEKLRQFKDIKLVPRDPNLKEVHHLYMFSFEKRDELVQHLKSQSIDAKIHYPIPMHLQPASKKYGYKEGDFPLSEKLARKTISIPVHEFITKTHLNQVISSIGSFL